MKKRTPQYKVHFGVFQTFKNKKNYMTYTSPI